MPTYEYTCQQHGPFKATASLANFDTPQNCPTCHQLAPRNLMSAPLISTKGPRPKANQSAGHKGPKVKHAPGCACCS